MWLHQVTVDKNVHKYISPKLCLTPEIKSKYFRIGECVGIGQTTVPQYKGNLYFTHVHKDIVYIDILSTTTIVK